MKINFIHPNKNRNFEKYCAVVYLFFELLIERKKYFLKSVQNKKCKIRLYVPTTIIY